MKNLFVFASLAFLIGSVFSQEKGVCRVWKCQEGLGGDNIGNNRTCALKNGDVNAVEACVPDNFLCNIKVDLDKDINNCTALDALPWKKNLPAGDDCGGNSTCFDKFKCRSIGGQRICDGLDEGFKCKNDKQCNPGLFCAYLGFIKGSKCQKVKNYTEACNGKTRCRFGSACVNFTCTQFGNLTDGTVFEYMDDEKYPKINSTQDYPEIYRVCENFWAFRIGKNSTSNRYLFECSGGPEKQFKNYARQDGNFECNFTITTNNGTQINTTHQAMCGFNKDSNFYCPSRRGPIEYESQNVIAREIWKNAPSTCHHRTSIQYCPEIQNKLLLQKAFADVLVTELITSEYNYTMIANNDRCVGNAIMETKNFWRIIDSANIVYVTAVISAGITMILF